MSFSNCEVLPHISDWFGMLLGKQPYNKKTVEDHAEKALKAIAVLENHFLIHTYLVGERPTLADYYLTSQISRGFEFVLDKKFRDAQPNVTRWYNTMTNQPTWKAIIDKPIMIDEAIKYTPPKKEPKAPKAAAAAATPKAAPKEKEVEEEEPAAPKAAKHPLEALPKPELILDDWKRKYSNFDTRSDALPWFWEQYKADEYSLWRVDYKYNEELKQVFMSSNLVGKTASTL